jgi:hypothetical protein
MNLVHSAIDKIIDNLLLGNEIPGIVFNSIMISVLANNEIKVFFIKDDKEICSYRAVVRNGDFLTLNGFEGKLNLDLGSIP